MARREYTAGRATSLASSFAIGASTFTIADDGSEATWPTSADYDFFVTIGAGTSNEERVLCSERTGRTITVAAGGRGKDATGEKNHAAGETAWPSLSAQDVDEANAHINSTGYSSHSQTVHGLGSGEGVVVGTTKEQTLTLKTLTTPKINENVTLTATATELNILDGATLSTAELNYVDGVTSAIQTQLNTLTADLSTAVPAGIISQFAGASAPAGYFLCDGQAISRSTYATLFGVVGTTYGAGDGATTFNVPNLKGRVPVGLDASQTEFNDLAETGGAKEVTLTEAQMPTHSHQFLFGRDGSLGISNTYVTQVSPTFVGAGSSTGAGSGEAHPNLQPYIVVNYIIKT
jgi:microcystin-dependent protein